MNTLFQKLPYVRAQNEKILFTRVGVFRKMEVKVYQIAITV
jgi:hypothetical protein